MKYQLLSVLLLFFLLVFASISFGQDDACSRNFTCGYLINVSYPFWKEGSEICYSQAFKIDCRDHIPIITTISGEYKVLSIDQTLKVMTIVPMDYWGNVCPHVFSNITLNPHFNLSSENQNISFFYNCDFPPRSPIPENYRFGCPPNNSQQLNAFYATEELLRNWKLPPEVRECKERVNIPVPDSFGDITNMDDLLDILKGGFNVSYYDAACQANSSRCPEVSNISPQEKERGNCPVFSFVPCEKSKEKTELDFSITVD